MNIKYILIIFLIGICLISPLYASDNQTDTLEGSQTNVINITNNNYDNYFERYTGTILEGTINPGDTIRIGNVTNMVFVIDRPLEITTISNNDVIKNGYVKLVNGSSGSVIHGLNIINDKLNFYTDGIMSSNLHGIGLFYTNNNTLYNNKVRLAYGFGVHALPMGSSSNNRIYNNSLISTLSTCVPMSECDNNIFYNNYLQTTQANIIYYNPWGHAGYSGNGICINNTYIGNVLNGINKESEFLIGFCLGNSHMESSMENGLPVNKITSSDYDVIINNTISNVYSGILPLTLNSVAYNNKIINITKAAILSESINNISDNIFENVYMAIGVIGDNGTICNNVIKNASRAIWSMNDNTTIYNNTFDIIDSYYAITLEGNNGQILNNEITVKNYGEAIRLLGNNTVISENDIKTSVDTAIYVLSSNNTILNNIISSNLYGIYIDSESYIKYYNRDVFIGFSYSIVFNQGKIYNNSISNNVINSGSYSIYLWGTVYNTTILSNNMTTKESTGILMDISDPFSNFISNNLINGQFINYTGIVLNDDSFRIYFNDNGTFKFNNIDKSILLVITHLTDKEMIINKQMEIMGGINTNLLTNVHIILLNESNGSLIHDLTFRNTNKSMITVFDSGDVKIYNNDYYLSGNSNELLYAINLNSTDNITITNNNIYLGCQNQAIEGVTINNSSSLLLNNNTLILESNKLINALTCINLNSSNFTNNSIQIYGEGQFYTLDIENSTYLEFINNNFLSSSSSNSTSLSLLNSSNIKFKTNNFDTKSNHNQNFIIDSNNVSFELNKFKDISTGAVENYLFDINTSDNISILNNEIYSNALNTLTTNDCVEIDKNHFVIYDGNINSYFNSKGEFKNDLINENNSILFDNLKLKHYDLIFNNLINITSYNKLSVIDATLTFNSQASYSNINGLTFDLVNNPAIIINSASNLNIDDNNFNIINNASESLFAIKIVAKSSNNNIFDNNFFMGGYGELVGVVISNYYDGYYGLSPVNNQISNNNFYITSNDTAIVVYNSMSDKTTIISNEITVDAKNAYAIYNDYSPEYKVFMSTIITSNTLITDNSISANGESVIFIYSKGLKTTVDSNSLSSSSNSSYAYIGNETDGDLIKYNYMMINGSGIIDSVIGHVKQAPIYFTNDSSNVLILENHIVSNYNPGDDYAIYIENKTNGVIIKDNYLISDNYRRYSNDAIYAPSAVLDNNALYVVYVSVDGSDDNGNGSKSNPFKTIKNALNEVINEGIVYVLNGVYNESDIVISKTVTLTGIGNVVINSTNSSLFTIARSGVFNVNNITFMNANSQKGSTFYNNGKLKLNNVTIINSTASTYGGGIYNNGDLLVVNSTLKSNAAKIGGVIANYKNANIIDSKFINNGHLFNISGTAIYNSDKGILNILGCEFLNNSADSVYFEKGMSDTVDQFDLKYGSGGAIYNRGNLYVNDSSFDSNYAYHSGGAIVSRSSSCNNVEISNSNFTNNLAIVGSGGAISISDANIKISNSTFISNSLRESIGGAMYISSSSGIIYNSTFYKNSAEYGGGALGIRKSNIDLILCNISDNNADYGGAILVQSTRSGNHIVENINIYNSTITNNRGFQWGSVMNVQYGINLNIKNSNIYDNFAGNGETISFMALGNEGPVNVIDVNHNWWGSENGPTDDIWINSQYFRDWDRHMNTWGVITPDEPNNPNPNNGGQRPGTSENVVNSGGSTSSNLISNGGGNIGGGSGYGTGFGLGFGNGFGNGAGQGSGNRSGISNGDGEGSIGSGSGYAGNYSNGEGTLGNLGSASTSGAGGSSSSSQSSSEGGKAYEINKNISKDIEANSIYLSLFLALFILILFIFGYKRQSDKEDEYE